MSQLWSTATVVGQFETEAPAVGRSAVRFGLLTPAVVLLGALVAYRRLSCAGRTPQRLPVVLDRREVRSLIAHSPHTANEVHGTLQ